MNKIKPIEDLADDAGPGDLILFRLESDSSDRKVRENTVVPGYRYPDGRIYPCCGNGSLGRPFIQFAKRAVDISDGTYLGALILGYEVVIRAKKNK